MVRGIFDDSLKLLLFYFFIKHLLWLAVGIAYCSFNEHQQQTLVSETHKKVMRLKLSEHFRCSIRVFFTEEKSIFKRIYFCHTCL